MPVHFPIEIFFFSISLLFAEKKIKFSVCYTHKISFFGLIVVGTSVSLSLPLHLNTCNSNAMLQSLNFSIIMFNFYLESEDRFLEKKLRKNHDHVSDLKTLVRGSF